tara:strand:+ start:2128 stop:2565 length:438 start_codon:yes stop_codon:yes gene_type:complete
MSKTLETLSPIELLAMAKAVELRNVNCETALPPVSTAHVDFTVRVKGELVRGDRSERAATNRARTSQAMIMLLVMSGVVRKHTPSKIIQAWRDFGSLDKAGMSARLNTLSVEDKALFDECMELFESEIVGNLPRIPTKGYVKFNG